MNCEAYSSSFGLFECDLLETILIFLLSSIEFITLIFFELESPFILNEPISLDPYHVISKTGAYTTPKIGLESFISAMLTVNSPLRLINSLVPSNGSISQKLFHFFRS